MRDIYYVSKLHLIYVIRTLLSSIFYADYDEKILINAVKNKDFSYFFKTKCNSNLKILIG